VRSACRAWLFGVELKRALLIRSRESGIVCSNLATSASVVDPKSVIYLHGMGAGLPRNPCSSIRFGNPNAKKSADVGLRSVVVQFGIAPRAHLRPLLPRRCSSNGNFCAAENAAQSLCPLPRSRSLALMSCGSDARRAHCHLCGKVQPADAGGIISPFSECREAQSGRSALERDFLRAQPHIASRSPRAEQ